MLENLTRSALEGSDYEDGKIRIDNAIREYDQAVMHLTAHVIAGIKYQQDTSQKQKQNEDFLKWLSPSYWLVENQLYAMRERRSKDTLHWAYDMDEFRTWRLAKVEESSEDRILWIRGTLGIGKSTMAGYFIDLLKCQYPNSIVAYFFCRSHQAGLTKARDIIRTLAYQCIQDNEAGRETLEELKKRDFRITEDLDVSFLFEKLLVTPLQCNQKDVYIVLDGLDEADTTTEDVSGRVELHILLTCLTKLPSTRLLFISRPSANISNIIPNMITRPIVQEENAKDIDTFVAKRLTELPKLSQLFKDANVEPAQYFQAKANGIFLWVDLVIQQLAKAKSQSVFRKYLEGFSNATGSMEKLYTSVLSRIDQEDKRWVIEIIAWVVVAERQLFLRELKSAVEWALDDKHVGFQEFLEVDCGSILYLVSDTVQPIHETFRSFVLSRENCPLDFYVDEKSTHARLASSCLQRLSKASEHDVFNSYCLINWVAHLSKATVTGQSQLLVDLHHFFMSDGVKLWIRRALDVGCVSFDPFSIIVELQSLETICKWLRKCDLKCDDADLELYEAVSWANTILDNPSVLGEIIGKEAACIWLYRDLRSIGEFATCFLLSLKYYWKRKDRILNNLHELNALAETEFKPIAVWTGNQGNCLKTQNLGLVFYNLQRWDDCIRCMRDNDALDSNINIQAYVGMAYVAKGDYDQALKAFEAALKKHPTDRDILRSLLEVCKGVRDYDRAVKAFKTLLEKDPTRPDIMDALLEACKGAGDYDRAVKAFEAALEKDPTHPYILLSLLEAYKGVGDYDRAVKAFEALLEKYPTHPDILRSLLEAYKGVGDYDRAVKTFEVALEKHPTHPDILRSLLEAYTGVGEYDRAVKAFEALLEKHPTHPGILRSLLEACKEVGDYGRAVKAFEAALEKYPTHFYILRSLLEAYKGVGEYDRAVKVFEALLEKYPTHHDILHSLLEAYKGVGEYDRAVKAFEATLEKHPTHPDILRGLLEACKGARDYDQAVKAFEAALEKHPTHPDILRSLLDAYMASGNHDGVIKRVQTVIDKQRVGLSSSLAYYVFEAYKAKNDYDGAIKMFKTEVERLPIQSWPWITLGLAYLGNKDYDAAVKLFQRAIRQLPLNYLFHKILGDIYFLKSEFDDAYNAYQLTIEKSRSKSVLHAYFYVGSQVPAVHAITIDERLGPSFLWYGLGKIHETRGDYDAAMNVYEGAIEACKTALETGKNNLLWEHQELDICSKKLDPFNPNKLPDVILWFVLGEAYKNRGDNVQAIRAFQEASVMQSSNLWLQNRINELEEVRVSSGSTIVFEV